MSDVREVNAAHDTDVADEIDRDFAGMPPEPLTAAQLLDEIERAALQAIEEHEEARAPLLAVLVDVVRLRQAAAS